MLGYQCDAGLPATIRGRQISFVDLDLDLIVGPDFAPHVRDAAQFEERREAMRYSDEAVAAAHRGIALARDLLGARAFPFNEMPARLLGEALAAEGPL